MALPASITIAPESPFEPEAVRLTRELDEELGALYPDASIHRVTPAQLEEADGTFLLARLDGRAIGCGALRPIGGRVAEVKRMFVRREARGCGIGRRILSDLESVARARGFASVRLETGTGQPEAIGLYESAGYRRIPCFGVYAHDPRSVCFEKAL